MRSLDRVDALALGVVVAAGVLRFWSLGDVGISHWDAGSFVAGPLGVGPYGKAPILPYYAPPLVPALNRMAFGLAGDTGAIALHALLGTLTVAATYAFGRRAFGAAAGLVGAAALAGMEFHLVYSRQPLTDVAFTLLFLLAIWSVWSGLERGGRAPFVAAGLACGAAMWTKYHGFFPLVAAGAVWATSWLRLRGTPEGRATWRAQLRGLLLAAGVALPFGLALLVQIEGSVGLAEFRANRQTWLADPGAYLIPMTGEFVGQCLVRWVSPLVLAAAVLGAVRALARCGHGAALSLAWIALFLATLPLYQNYPRLLVPMLVPLALLAGVGAAGMVERAPAAARTAWAAGAAVVLLGAGAWAARDSLAVSDRGYADVARFLDAAEPTGEPDLLVLQHAVLPYLADAPGAGTHGAGTQGAGARAAGAREAGARGPFLCYDEDAALAALRAGRFRFVALDVRTRHAAEWAEWEARARLDGLEPVALVPNPLPEPFLVNLTDFRTLDGLRAVGPDGPDQADVAWIRVYRRPGG